MGDLDARKRCDGLGASPEIEGLADVAQDQRAINVSRSSRTADGTERVSIELVPSAKAGLLRKLRFVSTDIKRQPVRVCGFTIDDDLTI